MAQHSLQHLGSWHRMFFIFVTLILIILNPSRQGSLPNPSTHDWLPGTAHRISHQTHSQTVILFIEGHGESYTNDVINPLPSISADNTIFSVLCSNCRSFPPRFDELVVLCLVNKLDILCRVETWLYAGILDSEVFIQNYFLARHDRNRHECMHEWWSSHLHTLFLIIYYYVVLLTWAS